MGRIREGGGRARKREREKEGDRESLEGGERRLQA
jgi:hypothetical protein